MYIYQPVYKSYHHFVGECIYCPSNMLYMHIRFRHGHLEKFVFFRRHFQQDEKHKHHENISQWHDRIVVLKNTP